MINNPQEIADLLGFAPFKTVIGRRSIADLFPRQKQRCGIYVLRFQNGDFYIGQAIDVTRRFCQHRKTHDDISQISFVRKSRLELTTYERDSIRLLEAHGVPLRNIDVMSFPNIVDCDLDDIVSESEQKLWLERTSPHSGKELRCDDETLRSRYARRFQVFLNKPYARTVIDILRAYVSRCVPFPEITERTFWSCSCLPGTFGPDALYATLSINWQEVCHFNDDAGRLRIAFQLTRSTMEQTYGHSVEMFRSAFPHAECVDVWYLPGGQDQFRVVFYDPVEAVQFLSHPAVVRAIRQLTLRLMRKGPTVYCRYHCYHLADQILASESQNISEQPLQPAVKAKPKRKRRSASSTVPETGAFFSIDDSQFR